MEQEIRHCKSADGTRIAYAVVGQGPAIIRAPNIHTSVEHDFELPYWRPILESLARRHTLVRYDARGSGASDRESARIGWKELLEDLQAVADAAGLEKFALLGPPGPGGMASLEFAARYPERVTHLILFQTLAKGPLHRPSQGSEYVNMTLSLIRQSWGSDDPMFRQFFIHRFFPEMKLGETRKVSDFLRGNASPEAAARLWGIWAEADVRSVLPRIKAPTLIFSLREPVGPRGAEAGGELASGIAGSRLVVVPRANVQPLNDDHETVELFLRETGKFLGDPPERSVLPRVRARVRRLIAVCHDAVGSVHYKVIYGIVALLAALATVVYYARVLL